MAYEDNPLNVIQDLEFWLVRVAGFNTYSDSTVYNYGLGMTEEWAKEEAFEGMDRDGIKDTSVDVVGTWHYVDGEWYNMASEPVIDRSGYDE